MDKKQKDPTLWIMTIGLIMFAVYIKIIEPIYQDWINFREAVNWTKILYTTYYIGFVLLIVTISSIVLHRIIKKYRYKKELEQNKILAIESENKNKIDYLEKLLNDDFCKGEYYISIEEIKSRIIETNKVFKQIHPKTAINYKGKIKDYNKMANDLIKYLERKKQEREEDEQRIKEAEENKRKESERQVKELFEFKKKKNSVEAVPLEHDYTAEIICKAKREMKYYNHKKAHVKYVKEQAVEYYKYNDIDTKPYISDKKDEEIYEQVRDDIKSGKIKLKKELVIVGGKLKEKFYIAKGLSDDIKRKALGQGFKHVRGVDLDGKVVPGGFYIKKGTSKESDYHFYTKHLLKEIDNRIRIEYCIEDKRVDAAIVVEFMKVGIEIETGTNDNEQLANKIEWLNHHFNLWMFIVPRKHFGKYSLYVDNKQSFCCTPKNGKKWIIDIIASIDQQYVIGEKT